jgi:hypothetical protein
VGADGKDVHSRDHRVADRRIPRASIHPRPGGPARGACARAGSHARGRLLLVRARDRDARDLAARIARARSEVSGTAGSNGICHRVERALSRLLCPARPWVPPLAGLPGSPCVRAAQVAVLCAALHPAAMLRGLFADLLGDCRRHRPLRPPPQAARPPLRARIRKPRHLAADAQARARLHALDQQGLRLGARAHARTRFEWRARGCHQYAASHARRTGGHAGAGQPA